MNVRSLERNGASGEEGGGVDTDTSTPRGRLTDEAGVPDIELSNVLIVGSKNNHFALEVVAVPFA